MGCRPVGCGGLLVWLPCPFSFDSSSFRCSHSASQLLPVFHQGSSVSCGGRFAREGGNQAGSSFAGLLQPPLCHSQGHRGLAACDRPQPVCSGLPFSHGDSAGSPPVSSSRRLAGFFGSEGRLPSGPGSPGISLLPEVLCSRGGLAILRPLLRPFTRVMAPISSIMHCHGFRILRYLDDWLVLGSSFRDLVWARDFLLWLCQELGVQVNLEKSSLTPTPTLDYLGMRLQTLPLRVFLTPKRVLKLNSLLAEFTSCQLQPLLLWRQLLGVMSSLASIVPGACLRMRSLQLRLNSASRLLADSDSVVWDSSCQEDLRWWSDDSHFLVGLPLDFSSPGLSLFTDASDTGWGASLGDDHISGSWSPHCSAFSINHLELLAVLYGIQGFLPLLRLRSVSQFVRGQHHRFGLLAEPGGLSLVPPLFHGSSDPPPLRISSDSLVPQFIPGRMNVLADSLSRRLQVLGSEWTLCFPAFQDLLCLWPATIDLFAASLNRRLPVYFSPMDDPQSVGKDVMMQPWDGLQAYDFPPSGLLHRVIVKIRQSRALELTLVASFWPQHPWFPDLLELLVAVPVFLPHRKDLLRQLHFHRFHQNLPVLRLTAFRISSAPPAPSASLWQWLANLPAGPPPE